MLNYMYEAFRGGLGSGSPRSGVPVVAEVVRPRVHLSREGMAFNSAVALIQDENHWVAGTPFARTYRGMIEPMVGPEAADRFCAHGAMAWSGMSNHQRATANFWAERTHGHSFEHINDHGGHRAVLKVMREYGESRGWGSMAA